MYSKYFCMCFKNMQIIHFKFYIKITDVKKVNNEKEIAFKNLAKTMVLKKQ